MTPIPIVLDLDEFSDPVLRNHAINQSYHGFARSMSAFLGDPPLSNWCTYAKFSSREVGASLRDLGVGLQTLAGVILAPLGPADGRLGRVLQDLRRLPGQAPLLRPLLRLALSRAGVPGGELAGALPGPLQLVRAVRHLLASMKRLSTQLIEGNRRVYRHVAPLYRAFLCAAASAPGGVPAPLSFDGDERGFLRACFGAYREARQAGAATPEALVTRRRLVLDANLWLGTHEQLLIVQPIFDPIRDELQAISGLIRITDPHGPQPMLVDHGDWGDFHERMGFSRTRTPPWDGTAAMPPPLLRPEERGWQGSISEYFMRRLDDPAMVEVPPDDLLPWGKDDEDPFTLLPRIPDEVPDP